MTSKQLINLSIKLQEATGPGNRLTILVEQITKSSEELQPLLRQVYDSPQGSGQDTTARGVLKTALEKAGIDLRSVNLWDVFSDVKSCQDKIESFVASTEVPLDFDTDHTIKNLRRFAKLLEQYWRNHAWKDLFPLLDIAVRVSSEFKTLRTCAELILANLTPTTASATHEEEALSIYLPMVKDIEAFARKLSSVGALYAEFCELFQVSTAQFPLRIVKIESGSFWVDVLGNTTITHLLEGAVVAAAAYFYRNFNREGKLREIPRDVEAVKAVLQLEAALASQNMDVPAMRERIAKAAVKVADNLNALLGGEPAVEVNGSVHPMTPDAQQKLLNGGTILRLSENTANATETRGQGDDPTQLPRQAPD